MQGLTIFSGVGNIPSQTCFKIGIEAYMKDTHHRVNALWPPIELAYEFQVENSQFSHMCIPNICILFFKLPHPYRHPNLGKETFSPDAQLKNLNFMNFNLRTQILVKQRASSFQISKMILVSTYKWLIINYVDDSGLNCP